MISKHYEEPIISVVLCLIGILAALGVISSVMWYVKAQEVERLKVTITAQRESIERLAEEIIDKRHKIQQANRLLSMSYPKADRPFISED